MVEQPGSADRSELKRFEALAGSWWNEAGPMAPLHKLNPVRLAYIRDQLCGHLGLDPKAHRALAGQNVLDIGCGGGLLCEPLARLGATVTGIDLVPANLVAARQHARAAALDVTYRDVAAEQLAAEGARFDLVCAMEVVEHVADVPGFLATCGALVRPGGGLILATLNRTLRSFALGIVAAEYVLGWLPRGTHQWQRFLRPSEVARGLRARQLRIADLTGVIYDPLRDRFRLSSDTAVNYMLFAVRDG
jgi:2-polyprenyl-6-hydroxyphenyl methylase / 3-demethylubiquinone-9 3-methyltransferase